MPSTIVFTDDVEKFLSGIEDPVIRARTRKRLEYISPDVELEAQFALHMTTKDWKTIVR